MFNQHISMHRQILNSVIDEFNSLGGDGHWRPSFSEFQEIALLYIHRENKELTIRDVLLDWLEENCD